MFYLRGLNRARHGLGWGKGVHSAPARTFCADDDVRGIDPVLVLLKAKCRSSLPRSVLRCLFTFLKVRCAEIVQCY
jgi:hypothetical protein